MKMRSRLRPMLRHAPALTLFAALTLWVTWPLWLAPGGMLESLGDPQLNTWILAWDRYALRHQLFDFTDANIFWPWGMALAYGELMLSQTVLALPVGLLTPAPAALHNVSLMEGYFFCAAAAYALAVYYFHRRGAATVAGLVYGFAGYRIAQSGHLQLVHGEFLPLMILGLEWTLAGDPLRRRKGAWLLGVAALGQWLASWYWAVFSFWVVGPYALVRWTMRRRRLDGRRIASAAIPLMLAAALTVPWTLPYLSLKASHVLIRPDEAFAGYDAAIGDWLAATPRSLLWGWMAQPGLTLERQLWPGLAGALGVVCGLLALARGDGRGRRRFPLGLWLGVTLLLLSFCLGGRTDSGFPLPWGVARAMIPGSEQIRVAARWMLPASLGLALLAGWAWHRWLGRRRWAGGVALALIAAGALTRPMPTVAVDSRPPAVWQWLDAQPWPTPVLLLPAEHPRAMLIAAWHRQPMVNGSNGYFPPLHRPRMQRMDRFPAPETLDELHRMHVRMVIIDLTQPGRSDTQWTQAIEAARAARPGLIVRSWREGDWRVVELTPPPPGPPRPEGVIAGTEIRVLD